MTEFHLHTQNKLPYTNTIQLLNLPLLSSMSIHRQAGKCHVEWTVSSDGLMDLVSGRAILTATKELDLKIAKHSTSINYLCIVDQYS